MFGAGLGAAENSVWRWWCSSYCTTPPRRRPFSFKHFSYGTPERNHHKAN